MKESPSRWGVGGGGTCFHHPLTFFDLIPCSSLIKQLKCFELRFPWFQKLLRYSLDLQKWLSLFPISVCLFYLLFITEEIIIASRLVFPWSQKSNQQFPCSIKITWKYPLFPKNKCSCSRVDVFPKHPGRSSKIKVTSSECRITLIHHQNLKCWLLDIYLLDRYDFL